MDFCFSLHFVSNGYAHLCCQGVPGSLALSKTRSVYIQQINIVFLQVYFSLFFSIERSKEITCYSLSQFQTSSSRVQKCFRVAQVVDLQFSNSDNCFQFSLNQSNLTGKLHCRFVSNSVQDLYLQTRRCSATCLLLRKRQSRSIIWPRDLCLICF